MLGNKLPTKLSNLQWEHGINHNIAGPTPQCKSLAKASTGWKAPRLAIKYLLWSALSCFAFIFHVLFVFNFFLFQLSCKKTLVFFYIFLFFFFVITSPFSAYANLSNVAWFPLYSFLYKILWIFIKSSHNTLLVLLRSALLNTLPLSEFLVIA